MDDPKILLKEIEEKKAAEAEAKAAKKVPTLVQLVSYACAYHK